jgi:ADP-heptose:LPS heptosyltransferase
MQSPRSILIISWGALGDMIVVTPALRAVRTAYPNARITVVSSPLMEQIAPAGTLCDRVLTYTHGELKSAAVTMRIGRRLASERFDLAFNFRYTSERSALLTFLSRARVRVGAGPRRWDWCYTHPAPYPQSHYNEMFRANDLVRSIGVHVADLRPFVQVAEEHRAFAKLAIPDARDRVVIIHPGASRIYRAWPAERYAEIARMLATQGKRVIVTWGSHERDVAQTVCTATGGCATLAPATPTVGHLAALFERASRVVCNNSGAMHVAVAAGTPVVALAGATELADWAPVGDKHRSVKAPGIAAAHSPEEELAIMKTITVEQVWGELKNED